MSMAATSFVPIPPLMTKARTFPEANIIAEQEIKAPPSVTDTFVMGVDSTLFRPGELRAWNP